MNNTVKEPLVFRVRLRYLFVMLSVIRCSSFQASALKQTLHGLLEPSPVPSRELVFTDSNGNDTPQRRAVKHRKIESCAAPSAVYGL